MTFHVPLSRPSLDPEPPLTPHLLLGGAGGSALQNPDAAVMRSALLLHAHLHHQSSLTVAATYPGKISYQMKFLQQSFYQAFSP